MNTKGLWPLVLALLLPLTGCGGGGGGGGGSSTPPPPPVADADPGGIWWGSATNTLTGEDYGLSGISVSSGEFRFIDDQEVQYIGTFQVSGNTVTGSLRAYAPVGSVFSNGATVVTGSISGTVRAFVSIDGQYSLITGDRGTFSLGYDALYERDSSISLLIGTWQNGPQNVFTVDSQGQVFGQDADGCVYSGSVSVINPNFNAYRLALDVSNCGQFTGSYSGLGLIDDFLASGDNGLFVYQISNANWVLTAAVTKF